MTCNTCKNSARCSFSWLAVSSRHISCNHYQIEQNIITREFYHFGSEYLSRPRSSINLRVISRENSDLVSYKYSDEDFEKYFKNMNISDHNLLLTEIIFKIRRSIKVGNILPNNMFINMEKFSLLDSYILESLINLNRELIKHEKKLIIEVTERHVELDSLIMQVIPKLQDKGITFALDDCVLDNIYHPFIKYFDFIKIDIDELYKKNNSHELIYYLIENGKQIVIERISTKEQLDYALTHPVHYLQGFYI